MTRSGPRIVHPPSDPLPTSREVPYRPTAVTYDDRGRPSTRTQVRSKRLPSPASPPLIATDLTPVPSVSPWASVLPLASIPSPRTNMAARSSPRSRSRLPMVRPTSADSGLLTGCDSTASVVRSKRATATVSDPSYTTSSRISPDVEQPIIAEPGNASTTARRGASSSRRSKLLKTRTRVPGPSQEGMGVDHPLVWFQPAVNRSTFNPLGRQRWLGSSPGTWLEEMADLSALHRGSGTAFHTAFQHLATVQPDASGGVRFSGAPHGSTVLRGCPGC